MTNATTSKRRPRMPPATPVSAPTALFTTPPNRPRPLPRRRPSISPVSPPSADRRRTTWAARITTRRSSRPPRCRSRSVVWDPTGGMASTSAARIPITRISPW